MSGHPSLPGARSARAALAPALAIPALAALLAASCGGLAAGGEQAARPEVAHVRLNGPIDVGALALVSRGVRTARADGASTLLIELDTPGGSLDVLWDLQKQLLAAQEDGLRLSCWIHDHAASAGALVALTCESVYISLAGTVGSAYPVIAGPSGLEALPVDGGVREKELSFLRAQFASMAEARGRPAALAMAMVDPDVEVRQVRVDGELRLVDGNAWDALRDSGAPYELVQTISARGHLLNLTARQATELRFADGIAESLAQVLVRLGHDPAAAGAPLERSATEKAVVWLERLTPLLILAGLVLGYLELKMPGFGLPGLLSVACFLLVVAGKYLVGLAQVAHIVAVALGLALILAEVLAFPGTLWLGISGAVLLGGGLILASLGPGFSFDDPRLPGRLLDTGLEYTLAAAGAIVVALALSRWLPRAPVLGRVVLAPSGPDAFAGALPETSELPAVGALGAALTDLRPVGKVELDARAGREFEARSQGPFLRRGERVRVVEAAVGRLVVEAASRSEGRRA